MLPQAVAVEEVLPVFDLRQGGGRQLVNIVIFEVTAPGVTGQGLADRLLKELAGKVE